MYSKESFKAACPQFFYSPFCMAAGPLKVDPAPSKILKVGSVALQISLVIAFLISLVSVFISSHDEFCKAGASDSFDAESHTRGKTHSLMGYTTLATILFIMLLIYIYAMLFRPTHGEYRLSTWEVSMSGILIGVLGSISSGCMLRTLPSSNSTEDKVHKSMDGLRLMFTIFLIFFIFVTMLGIGIFASVGKHETIKLA